MATLLELSNELEDILQDSSYTCERRAAAINRALREVAGVVPVPLPYLETIASVSTTADKAFSALPADFQRDEMEHLFSAQQNLEVKKVQSLTYLQELYPSLDLSGPVRAWTIFSRSLYYQPIPETPDSLRIVYFRYPTPLTVNSGTTTDACVPNCLPEHLHEKLLVSRAAEILFSRIEDGADGAKVNTNYYHGQYREGISELISWIGPPKRRPVQPNDLMQTYFYNES